MELIVIALLLYFGGKWLVKRTGPMPHVCRGCGRIYHGAACTRCCAHGEDRPNCEQCLLEGKRISADVVPVTGDYEPPSSRWAEDAAEHEPTDEELFGYA